MNQANTPENVAPDASHDPPAADVETVSRSPMSTVREWSRRLLVCNPLFLCSAALLLFGVNRLSIDPGFMREETDNLFFNFFALQIYEVLVVGTAIVLARRKVWYDSALLVVLENGLVLVPFMLISQATLLDAPIATTLTLAGGAVALARFGAVRRGYPRFHLPSRALLLGAMILAANVALPRIFRPLMEADVENWRGPNLLAWFVGLPLLAAGANLLPRPTRHGGLNPERAWLPLFCYGLWITGTAAHLWCVQHICSLPFELSQLAPVIGVAAWTVHRRLRDIVPEPALRLEKAVLLLTLLAPALAVGHTSMLFWIGVANAACLLGQALLGRQHLRALAGHLTVSCAALALAGLPEEWGRLGLSGFTRMHAAALGASVYVVAQAWRTHRPEPAFLAAIVVACDMGWVSAETTTHPAVQAGLLFLLLHSIRWDVRDHFAAWLLRCLAAGWWVVDAWMLTRGGSWLANSLTCGGALLVLGGCGLSWVLQRKPRSWVLPGAAIATLCAPPSNWLIRMGSTGLAAIAGSFLLFGAGLAIAWTRPRWETASDGTQAGPENKSS